jgi:hypothetical protein
VDRAAVGFRAKTGRAIAVVLAGPAKEPRFIWRGEIPLVEKGLLETGPYHTVLDLPWSEAVIAVRPLETAIARTAREEVARVIKAMRTLDVDVCAAGVVGSSPRPLERIGNLHIRAHAAEGILFRHVLEVAAEQLALPCVACADDELPLDPKTLQRIKDLGRVAGPPWRSDERLAAAAAWIALRR